MNALWLALSLLAPLALVAAPDGPPGQEGSGIGHSGGERDQFGHHMRMPGSEGFFPLLEFQGALRVGDRKTAIAVRHGLGGSRAWLLIGHRRGPIRGPLGIELLVADLVLVHPFSLDGPLGAPGRGHAELGVVLHEALGGLEFTFQVFVLDPGSKIGLSSSNGLFLRIFPERALAPPEERPGREKR